ncbi:winged helix-turn-helix domain-containing protein [Sphingomonas sp. 1P08PE]|uniref:winged helix-turn-helix domain-containing protein n=1 Tax=Sphingomonas sp. 1P08PE TaxID=554122 RepID=UPI0039A3C9B0
MAGANELIHQSLRLKIMAALNAARRDGPLDFTRLRALVEASDGNLSTHLSTLEAAGYVMLERAFVGKKPRTRITMTGEGATAFRAHVAYLRDLLSE